MSKDRIDVSSNSKVSMPIFNLIGIIAMVGTVVMMYATVTQRLTSLETSRELNGPEILVENGSLDEVMTTDAPSDAWVVTYEIDGTVHRDLTRGSRVKLFDMYYDKFKMGVKIIDYGKGTIKPALWGYNNTTAPKKKKRK